MMIVHELPSAFPARLPARDEKLRPPGGVSLGYL
jgi:hypothetical protein